MAASPTGQYRSINRRFTFANLPVIIVLILWVVGSLVILGLPDWTIKNGFEIARNFSVGREPEWKIAAVEGIKQAASINVVLALLALGTLPWWCGKSNRTVDEKNGTPGRPFSAFFLAGLLAVVALAGTLRWNLAHGGMWWDELWNTKMATVGQFRSGSRHPDELRFYATDFARCAWYYPKPTNHVPVALAGKVFHTLWARVTDAPDGQFDEFVIRLPVFLSALGSVFLIGYYTRRWLGTGTGLLAAFLLAVHPWFIRYGVDARAYGPLVLFMLVGIYSLERALALDRWRHWVLFGSAQFFLMWNHLHSVWFCAALTGAGMVVLWRKEQRDGVWARFGRLIVVNAVAAGAFLQVFLPNLIQLRHWLANGTADSSFLNGEMFASTLSLMFFGVEPSWGNARIETEGLVSWESMTGGNLWIMWGAIGIAIGLTIAGMIVLWRSQRRAMLILIALFVAGGSFLAISAMHKVYFYPRFAIPLLPVAIIAISAGLWHCSEWAARKWWRRAPAALATVGAAVFVAICLPQIRVLRSRSYAPMREVAEFLEQRAADGQILAIGYGLGGRVLQVYYPKAQYVLDPPGGIALQEALDRAGAKGIPAYVYYGHSVFNRGVLPDGFELLDDPAKFEEVAAFPGIEPEFYFRVLKAKPSR